MPAGSKTGPSDVKRINLALQGGGAHGAFTWGVLDRLLEEPRLQIEGISATSAGAMNAAVTASGMALGGPEGARRALGDFWRAIGAAARTSPLQPSVFDRFMRNHRLDFSPTFLAFDMVVRTLSPYQFNPFAFNPLRDVVEKAVDFAALRDPAAPVKLFLCATNVRSGKIRIFQNAEMSADAVMASGCLPFLFQAVEIEGEAYWDGGYMGNPAIFPLIYNCGTEDVVVVHINPLERPEIPKSAADIFNRINEISFNSSLMREMRAIEFVSRLIDEGKLADGSMKRMRIHAIEDSATMVGLSVNSKLNADLEFLEGLFEKGRARADDWLKETFELIGQRSSVDLRATYL